ncbi:MAG: hypothetical protein DWQ20_00825 [Actinobacteria bacterium]|nr:MAG: hypothetical protein DWQ20_00825 [Actinomycetota bacterium]
MGGAEMRVCDFQRLGIRSWDIITFGRRTRIVIEASDKYVTFPILHCSWTDRPHTTRYACDFQPGDGVRVGRVKEPGDLLLAILADAQGGPRVIRCSDMRRAL